MALNTALISLAGVALAADLAVVNFSGYNDRLAIPNLGADRFASVSRKIDGPVSVQFHSARVSEVLNWLDSNGFSYVLSDGEIAPNKSITLNVKNQPVEAIADAIAQAIGGHWENNKGIHVYAKGTTSLNWLNVPAGSGYMWGESIPGKQAKGSDWTDMQASPELQKQLEKQFGPEFQKKMQEQFGPKFQKQMQDQFGPDFQKRMQKQFGPEFQKQMQDQFGPKFQKQMEELGKQFGEKSNDPAAQKKLEKQMEELGKRMGDQFGPKFQKQMEEQFGPKFQKQMEDQFGPKFQKQMEDQFGPKFQKQMEELGAQIEKEVQQHGKDFQRMDSMRSGSPMKGMGSSHITIGKNGIDATKFLKTLTPEQKDTQSKQGYIWYNDLTREQKEMFDGIKGKFDMKMKVNDEEVRVRRN